MLTMSHTCIYCHKSYSSKSNLKAHQQRTKKCIDTRTNAILVKELIKDGYKEDMLDRLDRLDRIDKIDRLDKIDKSPGNIYRTLSTTGQTIAQTTSQTTSISEICGCKDCGKINSQLNSIAAVNNKIFCQMLDIHKQMTYLSVAFDHIQKKEGEIIRNNTPNICVS